MNATQAELTEEQSSVATVALSDGSSLLGDEFTILKKVGSGGFGITYLAHDNFLDRDVVIKECFPEVFCERQGGTVRVRSRGNHDKYRSIVSMFTREARSIAKMRHPNIIGVHRVFEDNDTAYIVLDLIDGEDLLDIIEKDPRKLPPAQVKDILIKLLDAVQTVHDEDLLHRDISPDNILLDKWGAPVLIDFGAAREEASRETRALSTVLVVKDGYSPHEFYFAGGKQTPSSDLYALAATFYHVITGAPPPNSQTRMADVAAGNPDPCTPLVGRFDEYDASFLRAIDKAMCVLPRDRLKSASEWISKIDTRNTETEPFMLPPVDQSLEKALNRLVSETNEQLEKTPEQSDSGEYGQRQKSPVAVPEWVSEFNQETVQRKGSKDWLSKAKYPDSKGRTVSHNTMRSGRVPLGSVLRTVLYLMVIATFLLVTYATIFAA